MMRRPACPLPPHAAERRGLAWVFGAFVICPCHLPLTLGVVAGAMSGTAAGAAIGGHPYLAGGLISLLWLAATWHGVGYLRAASTARRPGPAAR